MELVPTWLSKRPYVAELDFSGIVVDSNGTDLDNGQEIFGIVAGLLLSSRVMSHAYV